MLPRQPFSDTFDASSSPTSCERELTGSAEQDIRSASPRAVACRMSMGTRIDANEVHHVLVDSKTRVPQTRSATIDRPRLTTRLTAGADLPLVVVSAPVGFGKTTLLTDWARHDGRTFAWVSLDRDDDDSVSLVRSICSAVARVRPIDPALFKDVAAPGTSILGQIVPRLVASIDAVDDPLVLVLNNLHEVDSLECRDVINLLLDLLPRSVQVAVSSRREVWLAGGRRRMRGEVLELGAADLAFDEAETEAFLVEAGMRVTPERVRQLLAADRGLAGGSGPVRARPPRGRRVDPFGGRARRTRSCRLRLHPIRSAVGAARRDVELPPPDGDPRCVVSVVVRRGPRLDELRRDPGVVGRCQSVHHAARRRGRVVPIPPVVPGGTARRERSQQQRRHHHAAPSPSCALVGGRPVGRAHDRARACRR